MGKPFFLVTVVALALQACATPPDPLSGEVLTAEQVNAIALPRTPSAAEVRYRQLATKPTPSTWQVGATWRFVITGDKGARRVVVFRITDEPEKACLVNIDDPSGWKKLEVVE